jgi:glucose/arabinose dehydrogenase
VLLIFFSACEDDDEEEISNQFPLVNISEDFRIEKVVDGLTYPTSLAWDDQDRMYVAEAGGGLDPETLAPIRILRIEAGDKTEVVNLTNKGIVASLVGMVWHNDNFYITHRAEDLTGAVSRVSLDGQVTNVFKGIIDSQAEHQINDIRIGSDGLMYVTVGPAGNAGVVGPSIAPWVKKSPDLHTTPCQDIVLLGRNFKTPDFRTEDTGDTVLTGAYVPFGTETSPGQVIQGVTLCGGSILKFDPDNPANIGVHSWGFRNLIGIAWDGQGNMYGSENGFDVRGSRPVGDDMDASLRISEGRWYGIPDFSTGREPLTEAKFEVPDSLQAMVIVNGQPQGKDLNFVIDHAASGLTPPTPSDVLGRHDINSSPSMIDVAPASWGDWAGHVFIAEWGDLAPPTNPIRGKNPAEGYRVVRIDPETGQMTPFVANAGGGPASAQQQAGQGIERPFDVQFGPDGAMYIVDYGVVKIDKSRKPPYDYKAGTGVIWKVTPE